MCRRWGDIWTADSQALGKMQAVGPEETHIRIYKDEPQKSNENGVSDNTGSLCPLLGVPVPHNRTS